MVKKNLYAGPWLGEFGWELCWWNPYIRAKAEHYEEVTVAAPQGSEYLYADFVTNFIPLKTDGGFDFYKGELIQGDTSIPPGCEVIRPEKIWPQRKPSEWVVEGERRWRKLAPGLKGPNYCVCAFRPDKVYKNRLFPGKSWPEKYCKALINLLKDEDWHDGVICIGGKGNFCPPEADDFREIPLRELCGLLSNARVVIGPSSGPLHLAQLNEAPVVTWYGVHPEASRPRYTQHWNPFHAPVRFMDQKQPEPEQVLGTIRELVANV